MIHYSSQQQKTIDSRNKNVVVSASAGSGKTSVLVERLCRLVIDDQIPINEILAMTFTDDAANEMKARLKHRLSSLEPTPYILDQLALLETADISTIDSFCYKIVQRYYYQIPIPYAMALHVDNGSLRSQAFELAYERALISLEGERIAAMNRYFAAFNVSSETLFKAINRFLEMANAKADPKGWIESCKQEHADVKKWFLTFFQERVETMISIVQEMLDELDEMEFSKIKTYESNKELFEQKALYLKRCQDDLVQEEYDRFARDFIAYIDTTKRFPSTVNKKSFANIKKEFQSMESAITENLFDLRQFQDDQERTQPILETWCDLSILLMDYFQEEKERLQILDFSDMEHFAYRLLCIPTIQEQVKNQFKTILIDEFQDTNELQESIIQQIASKNNVFRVGDIKQSIYGFRQADPSIMIHHMEKEDENNETLVMSENYRSTKTLIDFNNTFYEKIMNLSFLDSRFLPSDRAMPGTSKQESSPQYPVRFLFSQYEPWAIEHENQKREAKKLHRAHRVDLIANDILKHHQAGVPYRSMCILTRTHGTHQALKDGLEAYGIPVLAEIDHGFYTNQAVQIILSCLQIIQDPNQDIPLMAALCSPIGQVDQATLSKIMIENDAPVSLFSKVRNESFMKELNAIFQWKKEPVATIVRKLYNFHNYYYLFTNGQDKTNLDLLLERASQYANPYDLNGFIELILQEADLDKTAEAFPYGKEEDVVKIKTMHHSKGLQFPIVYLLSDHERRDMEASSPILLDDHLGVSLRSLNDKGNVYRPSLSSIAFKTKKFHKEIEEEMRILYVATTRAEEELVIVDAIKSLDDYRYPLNTRALLQNQNYTGWLLHTFLTEPSSLFELEEVEELYERKIVQRKFMKNIPFQIFDQKVRSVESMTASGSKKQPQWSPVRMRINDRLKRGTMLHELVSTLPFPYQKDVLETKLTNQEDIQQILALNANPEYVGWMARKHIFECPYTVKKGNELIHGFMDLVVFEDKRTIILDFKSDYVNDEKELVSMYQKQLMIYKEAMELIEPNRTIVTYIYSFYLKKLIQIAC
ncbi:UvrD-helicase domain-containing protein [Dubosiella newyorkensis]|uniref:UvrD-helicase domain-containing protein n=1 Tax=Dubosiella newyorkensis TaxID=1862672 RepID=UPI00248BFAF6|nr:UvrD-helicase domain-containing protein [Dubosiella newyorkensis]